MKKNKCRRICGVEDKLNKISILQEQSAIATSIFIELRHKCCLNILDIREYICLINNILIPQFIMMRKIQSWVMINLRLVFPDTPPYLSILIISYAWRLLLFINHRHLCNCPQHGKAHDYWFIHMPIAGYSASMIICWSKCNKLIRCFSAKKLILSQIS